MPHASRRALLAAPILLAAPRLARAEGPDWPNQTVRYVNPYPPGGSTDILSRIVCAKLSEISGQQFVVENRSGSGGDVGVDFVAKSKPDGYTVGLGGIASHAISPTLKRSLPFDPVKDFTFVSGLWQLPNLLILNEDIPAKTVPEFLALLKANPGKYSYGSAGPGTTLHLSGAMLGQMAGVDIMHVPYRGEAAGMIDLMAGRIQFMLANFPSAYALFKQGKVRALAVTGQQRSPVVPELPTVGEFLPGFHIVSWTTFTGPAGIPAPVVTRMNALVKRALAAEDLKKQFLEQGATPWWTTPEDIAAYRAAEYARLRPIILASGAVQD